MDVALVLLLPRKYLHKRIKDSHIYHYIWTCWNLVLISQLLYMGLGKKKLCIYRDVKGMYGNYEKAFFR